MTTAGNSLGRIQIRDLSIRLGQGSEAFEAVRDLSLEARPGEFVCLLGPSGCGKSTLLGALAGHLRPSAGSVRVDGRSVEGPSPQRGMVFQQHTLFPWRRVRDNVAFGLKMQGLARAERNRRAMEMLGLVGLADFAGRWPGQLSGGMQQRVEIARVLVNRPRLLLMDEPLASLDLKRKGEILPYLEHLHEELDIPVLYVSHSPDEVARLADHLVLLENGKVRASGPIGETLARVDLPLALDDDAGVVIEGTVSDHDPAYGLLTLVLPGSALQMRVAHAPLAPGKRLRFKVQARDVSLNLRDDAQSSILNRLPVRVLELVDTDTAAHVLVRLDAGGNPLLARITRYSRDQLQLRPGQLLWAQIKSVAVLA